MASVRLESVTKKFGDTVVVDEVTLAIDDREFLVLVGPSGVARQPACACSPASNTSMTA